MIRKACISVDHNDRFYVTTQVAARVLIQSKDQMPVKNGRIVLPGIMMIYRLTLHFKFSTSLNIMS